MYGSYDYCKHGRYVGGCGIDWMCHRCEMGDEDSTGRELLDYIVEAAKSLEISDQRIDEWLRLLSETSSTTIPQDTIMLLRAPYVNKVMELIREYNHIMSLANDLDDRGWLDREHDRIVQQYYEDHVREVEEERLDREWRREQIENDCYA